MPFNGNIVDSFVEIKLAERQDFLKVMETLTRIGRSEDGKLFQTCFILHKMGRYYIVHHREMEMLDRSGTRLTDDERAVRNRVAYLLHEWSREGGSLGVTLVNPEQVEDMAPMSEITVLSYSDKKNGDWELVPMYVTLSARKKQNQQGRYA